MPVHHLAKMLQLLQTETKRSDRISTASQHRHVADMQDSQTAVQDNCMFGYFYSFIF